MWTSYTIGFYFVSVSLLSVKTIYISYIPLHNSPYLLSTVLHNSSYSVSLLYLSVFLIFHEISIHPEYDNVIIRKFDKMMKPIQSLQVILMICFIHPSMDTFTESVHHFSKYLNSIIFFQRMEWFYGIWVLLKIFNIN